MDRRRQDYSLPLPVRRALRKLGRDIRDARLRRRIPMAVVAERASTTRKTIGRIESGDPAVSIGILATVLFVLGLSDRLGELADVKRDEQGLALEEERLPKRVRAKKKRPATPKAASPKGDDR
jgi:transcriptional regulator with XRE-family HTH domain